MSELKGKTIAITGGTGTLGRACVREIFSKYPDVKRLVIYSRDELKQLEMMEDYPEEADIPVNYYLGDVRDKARIIQVFEDVDYVIHTAAIKHVVMAEKNPEECLKTNVNGTENLVAACKARGVSRAVLISTDKAQNPLGVYGRSKLEAEKCFEEANSEDQTFKIVRLGNVIGARGSVYEAFQKQRKSGVLKVTHPDATRFCISQEESASFILDVLISNEPTVVSVPYMESVRIVDLAKEIAPECEIEFIGLRPGDKLHEEVGEQTSEELILEYKYSKYGA